MLNENSQNQESKMQVNLFFLFFIKLKSKTNLIRKPSLLNPTVAYRKYTELDQNMGPMARFLKKYGVVG